MKIAISISERLKQLNGSKPVLLGSNDEKEIGAIRIGIDATWTEMKHIAQPDIVSLLESDNSYDESWKSRGSTAT